MRFDWQNSRPHLLLLSKFLRPTSPKSFIGKDYWREALSEKPERAIKRFSEHGMLVGGDLESRLDCRFSSTKLKEMLKERGLSRSGRKSDLIQRLVEADPERMSKAVSEFSVYVCSESGVRIAEQYLTDRELERSRIEQEITGYLHQGMFKQASSAVACYEAQQVLPRGLGIDWKHHDTSRDVAILKAISQGKPKILKSVDQAKLESLRFAASMMYLWGVNRAKQWLPLEFQTGLNMNNDAAARMFLFYALHRAKLADYRRSAVVKALEILPAPDSCDVCRKLSGKRFKLNEAPELPYQHCTSKKGCRCTTLTIRE